MLLFGIWLALAASTGPLSLSEAARLAADGAPAVRRAADEAQAAQARRDAARAHLFPTLTAEAGVLSSTDPVDAFALALKQERFSASSFFASDPNHPSSTTDWSGSLTASWAIDLFGTARGRARAADASASAADHSALRARDGAAVEAMEAFVRARTAEQSLAILSERERDAERDLSLASSLFEQGMTTQADPARARAALAEVGAQQAAARASLVEARATLAALIGPEEASRPLADLPDPGAMPNDETGPAQRDDVFAAELSARAAGETAAAARAERFPAAFLQGRYEAHAPRPGERWGDASSIFGGLRVPLFASGAVRAGIAEASANARAAQEGAEEARRGAVRQATASRAAVSAADAKEESYAAARAAAGEAAKIQQARYEEGVGRLSDLIEARGAEVSARLAGVTARAERIVGRARLRLALGLSPEEEEKR